MLQITTLLVIQMQDCDHAIASTDDQRCANE